MNEEQVKWVREMAGMEIDNLRRLIMEADMALQMSTHWQICKLDVGACEFCLDAMNQHVEVRTRIKDIRESVGQSMFDSKYKYNRKGTK